MDVVGESMNTTKRLNLLRQNRKNDYSKLMPDKALKVVVGY